MCAGGLCCCSGCACRNQWYDKYFAYNMAVGMEEYELAMAPVKQQLFSQLLLELQQAQPPLSSTSGSSSPPFSLLEVGIGTGVWVDLADVVFTCVHGPLRSMPC